jgi:hypothetical protein
MTGELGFDYLQGQCSLLRRVTQHIAWATAFDARQGVPGFFTATGQPGAQVSRRGVRVKPKANAWRHDSRLPYVCVTWRRINQTEKSVLSVSLHLPSQKQRKVKHDVKLIP